VIGGLRRNGFHFDDIHAIVDNPSVRDIRNIPRFFSDATTFSSLPLNQSYRPVLQTTLAVDYRLGGGYDPIAFQIDTFVWFVALLAVTWTLLAHVLRAGGVGRPERWRSSRRPSTAFTRSAPRPSTM